MLRLIAHRLAISVPLVFLVSILTFVLLAIQRSSVAVAILGPNAPVASYEHLNHQFGLDQPVYTRYWHWLVAAMHGDLGHSWLTGQGVTAAIMQRLPVTVALIAGGLLLTSTVGVGLGIVAAVRGGAAGRIIDSLALFGMAVPSYWLALVMISLFAVTWRLLPATGYVPLTESFTGWARSLILPVVVIAVGAVAGLAKQTRDSMLDNLGRDYVIALRARGLPEHSIILKHALRNAAIPVVTVIGLYFVYMLSGTVFVETVFALPGLGGLAVTATTAHDIPVVLGTTVFFTLMVVLVNLIIDLAYGWLNPKLRVG